MSKNTKIENLKLVKDNTEIDPFGATYVKDIEQLAEEHKKDTFNRQVNDYVERLDRHAHLLDEYKEKFTEDMNNIELKPVFEGIIVKPFEINPFQQMRKQGNLYIDTGGYAPEIKSDDDGEMHEEEAYVKVGLVMEVGPDVKYIQVGDVVMWRKPSQLPIPFYKQGFFLIGEHAVVAVVNEGLTERFKNVK